MKDIVYQARFKAENDQAEFAVDSSTKKGGTEFTKITETRGVPGSDISKQKIMLFNSDLRKLINALTRGIEVLDSHKKEADNAR